MDRAEVKRFVRSVSRIQSHTGVAEEEREPEAEHTLEQAPLEKVLSLDPAAFERLCQRILRESGFTQVEVTGRSGDGGIDGRGVIRIGGLLSFRVIFQCKRYARSVGSAEVRDFRGAMVGRADKGLLITTGTFTRDAWEEATRDGAPPVDLIDGEQLVLKMKELGLGVTAREDVVVDEDWFERFKTAK